MRIFLNNELVELPRNPMTVADLLNWKNIKPDGTAVAINDRLILKNNWPVQKLEDMMNVTIITAAFGG